MIGNVSQLGGGDFIDRHRAQELFPAQGFDFPLNIAKIALEQDLAGSRLVRSGGRAGQKQRKEGNLRVQRIRASGSIIHFIWQEYMPAGGRWKEKFNLLTVPP